ncbi:ABC transporter permease [Methylomonas sp. LL1]|uniref:ABC transporter permease n=1 Tax=Methylomonas sp. LL1 TaxID=2785785 RepID=UPI0018C40EE7|nr:ABC transporter permease [Methylomonas sp. LL1]QPK64930.1 ABC transporter permease [Methylomonas sp. LL1]
MNSIESTQNDSSRRDVLTVIEAGRAAQDYWKNIWRQRELLYFLIWRDLLVRYKQTVVGTAWVLIRPLLTLMIFSVVFGRLAGLPSNGAPYTLLVFAGMLPWFFFATAVSDCTSSLSSNGALVGKIYFPRLIIPMNSVLVCLVDYLVSCLLIVGVMVWTGTTPTLRLLALPLLTLWICGLSFGIGIWCAALTVRYRDLRHLVPFLLQLGIYVSPVGYSATIVPERWRFEYSLNPMVGIIDGYRWSLLGNDFVAYLPGVGISALMTLVMIITGIFYFRRCEKTFVDFL